MDEMFYTDGDPLNSDANKPLNIDPNYYWLLKQVRAGLAATANSAGEISALHKDIKELVEKNYCINKDLEVLKITYNKDSLAAEIKINDLKKEVQRLKEKLSFSKIFPLFITTVLFTLGIIELIVRVVHYLQKVTPIP